MPCLVALICVPNETNIKQIMFFASVCVCSNIVLTSDVDVDVDAWIDIDMLMIEN